MRCSGISRAFNRQFGDQPITNLAYWSHPPQSAEESTLQGEVKIDGALTVIAPVAPAQGKMTAALAARRAETPRLEQAHIRFLQEIGAESTCCEARFIHIGSGSTSLSCSAEWGATRTTASMSASPLRFNIVVTNMPQT